MTTSQSLPVTAAAGATSANSQERRHGSIFDISANFFDACRLLSPSAAAAAPVSETTSEKESPNPIPVETLDDVSGSRNGFASSSSSPRWTCNTCKAEFESLQDQRSHFKSDIHRINVKLSVAGKDIIVNEDDVDELTSDSFKDFDISSISGSEDEGEALRERGSSLIRKGSIESGKAVVKQKLFFQLQTGERVSVSRCLLLSEWENLGVSDDGGAATFTQCLSERDVIERLRFLVHEVRDNTRLRIILLAGGGHFAGCVFDGNAVVVHKTFHRYVVRAKAGKKQSSKDASGRAAHSAGASLRRYNELALKKDIQELLAAWKPYFDASACIFVHAPSSNRHLLFDGDKAYFSHQHGVVRSVPLNVRRPTFKEAWRIYTQLTQFTYEEDDKETPIDTKEESVLTLRTTINGSQDTGKEDLKDNFNCREATEASLSWEKSDELHVSNENESEVIGTTTPLHEAAQCGDTLKVLELLEQGLDPCAKDERGRTPYMLANEKEVRNTFRRFMASNLDKWDWQAARVPSALTTEMEESQAAKQAEKDAKRKARAKELKKLRKAREKKAQAETASSQNVTVLTENHGSLSSVIKGQSQPRGGSQLSKEEELKRVQATEREKRAAAAERRLAAAAPALNTKGSETTDAPGTSLSNIGLATDTKCSCCNASLAGKVPFHRYNYKYCSTSCMHVHREILEDG